MRRSNSADRGWTRLSRLVWPALIVALLLAALGFGLRQAPGRAALAEARTEDLESTLAGQIGRAEAWYRINGYDEVATALRRRRRFGRSRRALCRRLASRLRSRCRWCRERIFRRFSATIR